MYKTIIEENKEKKVRIVCYEYDFESSISNDNDSYVREYVVEKKFLFFWIGIKRYSYLYNFYTKEKDITENLTYIKLCAEELFDHIIKDE